MNYLLIMSSILDNIENTLQHGDVEMLRKEINEKLDTLEDKLVCSIRTKADISYIDNLENNLESKVYQLTYENKKLCTELRNLYVKLSSVICLMIELTDDSSVAYQRRDSLKDYANDLIKSFNSSAEEMYIHTY